MCFDPHEFVGQVIYSVGNYDRQLVDDMLELLHRRELIPGEGGVVLEVGANIGTQTVYFCKSRFVGRVLAVEPDPRNLEYLRNNIGWNGLNDMVDVVPCAIGEAPSRGQLYRSKGNYGGSSLFAANHDDAVSVDIKPFSQILETTGIDERSISLVWMDIEGAEPMACRSMLGLLERRVPFMMEFSPAFYGPECTREFIAFLSGYYDRCLIYDQNVPSEISVKNLPEDISQANILLLP